MFQYIEKCLSPFLCGYRNDFSIQTALLGLVDKNGYAGGCTYGSIKAI